MGQAPGWRLRRPRAEPDFKYPSDTYAHPAPLPTDDPRGAALAAVDTPYKAIVQGTKWKGDVKVYDEKFNFGRTRAGHSVTLRAEVECKVAYLTAESTEAIPILLKGGVGHDHFTVVVKAKPERRLKGRVRAYCRKGQGKRPDFKYPSDTYAHPAPLPTDDPRGAALAAVDTPYKAIVQGTKWKGDVKVFDKKFNFGRTRTGHSVTLRAEVGCEVAYLTVESTEAIPILLKGGVGHDHFTVVVKAKPERRLKGRVRAYCRKGQGKRACKQLMRARIAQAQSSFN
ncbi:unnamed protein product [Plutella xylostella]|uniref:(diamondback moth) hypothetical protein n=1 Tax=Plutella xylostella TaxID=51655 RepID=A0A8S4FHS5_PLUXY|nr:unnamed protein product [Plutella xylostella]